MIVASENRTADALVATPIAEARHTAAPDDTPEIGTWWWVVDDDGPRAEYRADRGDYDLPGQRWLGCVIEVGSNYAKLEGVSLEERIALDHFHARCTLEPAPAVFINQRIEEHKGNVRRLTGEIQQLCHQLGVPVRGALASAEPPSQALATVSGTADVDAYKTALVIAKEKTLPDLFKQVAAEHGQMALWMKAELIPAQAELEAVKTVTGAIGDKIQTVELYAGLTENLVCVREGAPADNDTRVHLMQRRHYMDEECLARYEAGGMGFDDIKAFDKWIARDENFTRLLPHERAIVAFRVRRHDRRADDDSIATFIRLWMENEENRRTFLYIRNGRQLHRMETSIDFGAELFPSREDSSLLGDDELWVQRYGGSVKVITGRQRAEMYQEYREGRSYLAQKIWQWHRAGCPEDDWDYVAIDHPKETWNLKPGQTRRQSGKPRAWSEHSRCDGDDYELLTPHHIYYDDAMKRVRRAAFEHNRIAVIVQGLLDRSTCLHPHPPWRIWTPEGFAAGIELVYDVSRAIAAGDPVDFDAYRAQLAKSIRVGAYTLGQRQAWLDEMEDRHGSKWRSVIGYRDKGPPRIARVEEVRRDGSCVFRWERDRARPKWVNHPDKPGYLKADYPPIPVSWTCSADRLFCVDAYTPGDFRMFYDDPRTRADYLEWAPLLLAAEDWHHARRSPPTKKRRRTKQ